MLLPQVSQVSALGISEKDKDPCSWCTQAERGCPRRDEAPCGSWRRGGMKTPTAAARAGRHLSPDLRSPRSVSVACGPLPAGRPSPSLLKRSSPSSLSDPKLSRARSPRRWHEATAHPLAGFPGSVGWFQVAKHRVTQNDTLQIITEHGNPKRCPSPRVCTLLSAKALLQLPEAPVPVLRGTEPACGEKLRRALAAHGASTPLPRPASGFYFIPLLSHCITSR